MVFSVHAMRAHGEHMDRIMYIGTVISVGQADLGLYDYI